jgi:hypothetical protein
MDTRHDLCVTRRLSGRLSANCDFFLEPGEKSVSRVIGSYTTRRTEDDVIFSQRVCVDAPSMISRNI